MLDQAYFDEQHKQIEQAKADAAQAIARHRKKRERRRRLQWRIPLTIAAVSFIGVAVTPWPYQIVPWFLLMFTFPCGLATWIGLND